jgi:predicted small secreted protein
MRRTVLIGILLLVSVALGACATTQAGGVGAGAQPQVQLDRVEVAAYFPFAPPPARVPLVLAFVFNVTNPGSQTVTLEELRFAYGFEAKPGEYFTLNSPWVYDVVHIPPKATNTVRVVSVLDSAIVPATLAVSQGFRMQQLGLKGPDVVKAWFEDIGDFKYGIRVTEGVATFATPGGPVLVSFQDTFPKR